MDRVQVLLCFRGCAGVDVCAQQHVRLPMGQEGAGLLLLLWMLHLLSVLSERQLAAGTTMPYCTDIGWPAYATPLFGSAAAQATVALLLEQCNHALRMVCVARYAALMAMPPQCLRHLCNKLCTMFSMHACQLSPAAPSNAHTWLMLHGVHALGACSMHACLIPAMGHELGPRHVLDFARLCRSGRIHLHMCTTAKGEHHGEVRHGSHRQPMCPK
eukprot:347290-Chlamydomonas_euryale.AAC.4